MRGINTVRKKLVGEMPKLKGNQRIYIQRFINKNDIELSNVDVYDPDSRYTAKKLGETNIFEGVIQDKLYEVFMVEDSKADKVYEAWRSIETNAGGHHEWLIGSMDKGEYHGRK